jgi:glycosyltransferase involved in cell wall biosynthesis
VAPAGGSIPSELPDLLGALIRRGIDARLSPYPHPASTGHLAQWRRWSRPAGVARRPTPPAQWHFFEAAGAVPSSLAGPVRVITRVTAREATFLAVEEDTAAIEQAVRTSDVIEVLDPSVARRMHAIEPEKRVAVTAPFVHRSFFDQPPLEMRQPVANEAARVLSIGPLDWTSGFEYAAQAISGLVAAGLDVRWHVIGEGPGHTPLAYACHQLGIGDRVTIVPAGHFSQRARAMTQAHVLLSSQVIDGFTEPVAEALSGGLPVVMTNPGDLDHLAVEDDAAGVAPRRSPAALAAALEPILRDRGAAARMAARARRWAVDRLSSERRLPAFLELYGEAGEPA